MEAAVNTRQGKPKHPPGLYLLFFTELWERFSYYGMRALLTLYLTTALISGGLGFEKGVAMSIYGFFTGAVYFTPLIGGYLSDRYLGRRLAITIGGITMAAGNFVLFAEHSLLGLYLGLALLIIGNGFFKPNISTLVGELYPENDNRRDSAFTIFYMGINIGAFFAPLVCGYLAEDLFKTTVNGVVQYGFKYGFLAASIGMMIGQLIFNLLGNRYLGDIGKKPVGKSEDKAKAAAANAPLTKKEKQRTAVIIIITCFVVFFWAGFEQAGSSLTLYTDKFVDKQVFGYEVPTSWFQSLNPLFIVLLAPILSGLWVKLASSKRGDLKIPTKMGIGMIMLGMGYMVLLLAVLHTGSDENHILNKANVMFIVMTYFLHTLGELFLSPVGLSMVSKIAPVKLASLLMGVWLASTGVANILAGELASYTQSLGYLEVFGLIGLLAIVMGLLLLLVSRKLVQMME
ncbi:MULTISPECIES: peptide MFS transporter [Brevibacillus]|jgi:proton-dependent oligopeptide transporter, POT family|uniref:peptide MFS transporter n=1 Tax=Brevibacillus TaxID=55080 RepID=UPI001492ABA0|nr:MULTISPECIES: peptide MFS transporter [Brevibacillus]MBR8661633.1 peptide MFS transporter [Brevibacillus sp. NL20B1]MDT3415943.1 POT family proton-dependent oligopeptide transporter [Brevibacillus aydinogluensis]NNV03134.1 MFS transporter [Brevibacillus sp. MCWH]